MLLRSMARDRALGTLRSFTTSASMLNLEVAVAQGRLAGEVGILGQQAGESPPGRMEVTLFAGLIALEEVVASEMKRMRTPAGFHIFGVPEVRILLQQNVGSPPCTPSSMNAPLETHLTGSFFPALMVEAISSRQGACR